VERFGADRMTDAMFQKYDDNTGQHVREAFRLPPLFVGKAQDYNFATAYTGYMVAEAQVFGPERVEFDNQINTTILRALGAKSYRYRSTPLTLTDVQNQLKALGLVGGLFISGAETVKKLNEITGLDMRFEEVKTPVPIGSGLQPIKPVATNPLDNAGNLSSNQNVTQINAATGKPKVAGAGDTSNMPTYDTDKMMYKGEKVRKAEDFSHLITLASQWARLIGLESGPIVSEHERTQIRKSVMELDPEDTKFFNELLASKTLTMSDKDITSLGDFAGCAAHLTA
jgi:hypothetical protein